MRQNDGVSFALKFAYFIGPHTPNVIRGALSVTMTSVSTLLAPIFTPLLTLWLAGEHMDVSAGPMVWLIVKMVILPAGLVVLLVVVLHNALGYALGYATGKATGQTEQSSRTAEVGMQNSGLAATLAESYWEVWEATARERR